MSQKAPVLVLNAGSATLKYRLVGPDGRGPGGIVEHIGEPGGPIDHRAAVGPALASLPHGTPAAIGHRVVHGGDTVRSAVRVDADVEAVISRWAPMAPAHNPAALAVIGATRDAYPGVAQFAVFDTAFHATIPPAATTYAIDRGVAAAYGLRRFGFHGISVRYVRDRAAKLLGRPAEELNMIVLHLGNGASATAIAGGVSVDTSMGLSPLAGLVMGTRCGDLDPAITFDLARNGWRVDNIQDLYEKRSGLLGMCGDNDLRRVEQRIAEGDAQADLALDVYCRAIRHYVGAYHAELGRLDAIVFTAGVGENSHVVRRRSLGGLDALGITIDDAANRAARGPSVISAPDGKVAVCVVPTDEEHAIAEEISVLLTAGR